MLTRRSLAASFVLFAFAAAPMVYGQDPTGAPTKGARGGNGGFGGGGPGGGGPGGPGGGGPGGPGGGFGGRNAGPANDSAERLLQIEAVQEDLKIDDKTKAKIKDLGEKAVKERTKRREAVTKMAQAQAAQLAAQQNALVAEQLAEAGINVDPKTLNNNNNNNGGRGGRGNGGPGGNQLERQMMTVAMDSLQSSVDGQMLKLLSAAQKVRLKQIQLQQEGVRAFTQPNPEVVNKLGLSEEQLAEINSTNRELQQSQNQARQELFASIVPPDNNGGNNNGGGGRGGRGGFGGMQNLDEATRTKLGEAMQDLQAKSSATTMAAIGKILNKTQKALYEKMIGAPFDVSKLRGNGPGGPGGPGGPNAPATAATAKGGTPPADANPPANKANTGARKKLSDARGDN